MTVFTYSEARQKFSYVLDKAKIEGSVQIRRKDGQLFAISPIKNNTASPLDVAIVDSDVSTDEVVSIIREFRER
jgi:hypothetical protein